ncbi:MAG: C40 family peptidase [Nocardioidaceae bacterium]
MSAKPRWQRLVLLPVLACVSLLVVMSTVQPASAVTMARKHHRNHHILRAVNIAVHKVGDPYRYGASGPNAFDCSGLTMFAFDRAGLHLPRTAAAQYRSMRRIPKARMHRGDLMFFYDSSGIYHVAVFLGWHRGRRVLLHSPYPGRHVHRASPWTSSWVAATRRF